MISNYELFAGDTPENMKPIASGEFSNIRNNPIMQHVYFTPTDGRYVQLRAVQMLNEGEALKYDQLIVQ